MNPLLEASWEVLGLSWEVLGLSWDLPRPLLGRSGASLSLPWRALVHSLGALGRSWGALVSVLGRSGVLLGGPGPPRRVSRASQDAISGLFWDILGRILGAT